MRDVGHFAHPLDRHTLLFLEIQRRVLPLFATGVVCQGGEEIGQRVVDGQKTVGRWRRVAVDVQRHDQVLPLGIEIVIEHPDFGDAGVLNASNLHVYVWMFALCEAIIR